MSREDRNSACGTKHIHAELWCHPSIGSHLWGLRVLLMDKPPVRLQLHAVALAAWSQPWLSCGMPAQGSRARQHLLLPPAWAFSSVGQVPTVVSAQELRVGAPQRAPAPAGD